MKALRLALTAALAWAAASRGAATDLVFVGDVMVAEIPVHSSKRGMDPFAGLAKYLDPKRLRIANLECVIATSGTAEIKPFTFRAHPRTIPALPNISTA